VRWRGHWPAAGRIIVAERGAQTDMSHDRPSARGKKTIYVRRWAGSGNQLFQFAFGKALAVELDADLYFDADASGVAHEQFVLNFPKIIKQKVPPSGTPVYGGFAKSTPEEYEDIKRRIANGPADAILWGNFQTNHHIVKHEGAIREALAIEPLPEYQDCVAVCVRRGDCIQTGRYIDLSPRWFTAAVKHVKIRISGPSKVVVFSDDPAWCRANLPWEVVSQDAWHDLRAVRSCAGIVFTNSTFHWWGAWLANVPTVCAAAINYQYPETFYDPRWVQMHNDSVVSVPVEPGGHVASAIYGADCGRVDVTNLINKMHAQGLRDIRVCNEIAGDPAPNIVKRLELEFADGRTLRVLEGEIARLDDQSRGFYATAFAKYNLKSRGVLHIGANVGEEYHGYMQLGITKQIWVEPNPEIFKKLVSNISSNQHAMAINVCAGDENKDVTLHEASNRGLSSSILQLGTHLLHDPTVHYTRDITVPMRRMDGCLDDLEDINFLNMDVQGAELLALRGMGTLLGGMKYICVEVNNRCTYIGCALIGEIDAYLSKYGFHRVETRWINDSYGDAFYMKSISLCIPHYSGPNYDRTRMLLQSFEAVIGDQRISEVIIKDDHSDDKAHEQTIATLEGSPKVRIIRNEQNLGPYRNRMTAIERATNAWVIALDNDNVLEQEYLDKIFGQEWHEDTILAPDFAKPQFDFRRFRNLVITKRNVSTHMREPSFNVLINTGNYFVNRQKYLDVWDGSIDPATSDSEYFNYCWLAAGNKIKVVAGLEYFHRVHPQSYYVQNQDKAVGAHRMVQEKMAALERVNAS
jgi:FkbM family methyltransferase